MTFQPLPAASAAGVAAFVTARRNTDRTACLRWVAAQGVSKSDAGAVEVAKRTWAALPLLADPALKTLALQVLAAARGRNFTAADSFPSMVWYGGASDTYGGVRFFGTLAQFVEYVLVARSLEIAEKRCGWVVTPTSNSDGRRVNASTTAMHALNLDCDGRGDWDRLLSALRSIGLAFIAYQSGGWSSSTPKWHVLLPLARPFDTTSPEKIAAWKYAYNHARVVFGAVAELPGEGFDPTVETPCVPVFITERRRAEDPPRQVIWQEGAALDLDVLVCSLPAVDDDDAGNGAARANVEAIALDDARLEQIVATLCGPMSKILTGRRDLYLALPGALLDRGVVADDVRAIVEQISIRCPGDPAYTAKEVSDKHREHLHCIETTIGKYERGENYTRIGTIVESWPEVAYAIDSVLPNPLIASVLERLEARQAARPAGATSPANPPALGGVAPAATSSTPRVAAVVSLDEIKKRLRGLRSRRLKSKKVEDKLRGVILDALLNGEDLVLKDNGVLVRDGEGKPYDRERCISIAMNMIAFTLEIGTPFDAVREITRPSLFAMLREGETLELLMKAAENAFLRALGKKLDQYEKERAEALAEVERRERSRATTEVA